MLDHPGCLSVDSCSPAGLGQVGARKACSYHVNVREGLQGLDVVVERSIGKAVLENGLRRFPPLAEQLGLHACCLEPELNTADASKEPGNGQGSRGDVKVRHGEDDPTSF